MFFRAALRPIISEDVADVAAVSVNALCKTVEIRQVTGLYGIFRKDCKADVSEHFAKGGARGASSQEYPKKTEKPRDKVESRKRFKGNCHWCKKPGHKEVECRAKSRGDPKVQALSASKEPTRASEQTLKIRQDLDTWIECSSLLDSRANVTLIVEEYAENHGLKSQDCDMSIVWGNRVHIDKCYIIQIEAEEGKAVPILCYGIKEKIGLIDMDAPLLIGESDFEKLGWKLSRTSNNTNVDKKIALMDYNSSPKKEEIGTGAKQVRFRENDIMGTGAIPMEDEMPRSLEFNQTAYDMDKKGWPDGLSRVVDSLPRAFSEKDLVS